jgi:hypothetical protein
LKSGGNGNAGSTRLLNDTLNLGVGGQVRYASALFRKNVPNGPDMSDIVAIQFQDSSSTTGWGFGLIGTDQPFVGVGTGTNASGPPIVPGETYFIVTKIVTNAAPTLDMASIYVFGSGYRSEVPATEPLAADTVIGTNIASFIDRVRIFIGSGSTAALPGEIDQFRMGSTWADVVGSAVPEPSSLSLLCVAAAMARLRRSRA